MIRFHRTVLEAFISIVGFGFHCRSCFVSIDLFKMRDISFFRRVRSIFSFAVLELYFVLKPNFVATEPNYLYFWI